MPPRITANTDHETTPKGCPGWSERHQHRYKCRLVNEQGDLRLPEQHRGGCRSATGPAKLEIYEPEAAAVRRIFDEHVAGTSIRQIVRHLDQDGIASATGKNLWPPRTIGRILRSPALRGHRGLVSLRVRALPQPQALPQDSRPPQDWVEVPVTAIVTAEVFAAAQAIVPAMSHFSPRNNAPGVFLPRGLVVCGPCGLHLRFRSGKTTKVAGFSAAG